MSRAGVELFESKLDKPKFDAKAEIDLVTAAKRVYRKSSGFCGRAVEQSVWRLQFAVTGRDEALGIDFLAESVKVGDRSKTRRDHYPSGSNAVVKVLTPVTEASLELPSLLLKSLHNHRLKRLGDVYGGMQASAMLMRAQGVQAIAGMRKSPTTVDRPYMIMEKIGDGLDLVELVGKFGEKGLLASERSQRTFMLAICRLMAFVRFFHGHYERPICDIKPDNILPEFDEHGDIARLVMIDLDQSIGNQFTFTSDYYVKSEIETINLMAHAGRLSRADRAIDFRVLGRSLAVVSSCLGREDWFGFTPGRVICFHRALTVNTIEERVVGVDLVPKLLYELIHLKEGNKPRQAIMRATSGSSDAHLYLKAYDDALAQCQTRYKSAVDKWSDGDEEEAKACSSFRRG